MRIWSALKNGGVALALIITVVLGVVQSVNAADKVTLQPQSATMTEGETQDITVSLDEPIISGDMDPGFVNVYIENATTSRISTTTTAVFFNQGDWNAPQTFSITATDDALDNGDQVAKLTFSIYSNSEYYSNYGGTTSVTVLDNDSTTAEVNVTSPVAGQNVPAGSLMVTGTGTPGVEIAVIIDGDNKGTTTVDGSGNWNLVVPNISGGSHSIVARVQTSDHYAYLANQYTRSIDVVDVETHSYVYEITDANSAGVTYNEQKNIVYSAATFGDNCEILGYDPLAYEIVAGTASIVECHAVSMTISSDGNTAWLLYDDANNPGDYSVLAVDLNTHAGVSHTLTHVDNNQSSGIAVSPDQTELWIRTANGIHVFTTGDYSYIDFIPLGVSGSSWENNIVFNKAGTMAYSADGDGSVYVIDANTKIATDSVFAGVGTNMVALTPDEGQLYIGASYPSSAIYVMDTATNTITDSFETDPGLPPESLAITDDGQWVVGDDHGSGAIFFGNVNSGATVNNTIYAPGGGSYYTSTGNFVSPTLVKVLGATTTTSFNAIAYTSPNTGLNQHWLLNLK